MRRPLALAAAAMLSACTALQSPQDVANTYVLDAQPPPVSAPARGLVLAIGMPRARAGFNSAQMAYRRSPHELEYYAKSRWAEAPSRMLAPLLVQALGRSGGFRGVVQASSVAAADQRLDVELVRLLQDFGTPPSRVRLAVRVTLIEVGSRRVLATRELEEVEPAPSEDAYGGVIAANRALARLLGRIVAFCVNP